MYTPTNVVKTTGPHINDLKLYVMPPSNTKNLYIWTLLGGAEKRAVLMPSEKGECCVVNFSQVGSWYRDDEVAAWCVAYSSSCGVRMVKLAQKKVVLMPYVDLLTQEDFVNLETRRLIIVHIRELYSKGIINGGLTWYHIGWANSSKTQIVVICQGHTWSSNDCSK